MMNENMHKNTTDTNRNLLMLSNGWLIASKMRDDNRIYFYKSANSGSSWEQLCLTSVTTDNSHTITSSGTKVYCITFDGKSTIATYYEFDATDVLNDEQIGIGINFANSIIDEINPKVEVKSMCYRQSIIDRLDAQTRKGINKYGHTIDKSGHLKSLEQRIEYALEEATDLIVYLEDLKVAVKSIESENKELYEAVREIDVHIRSTDDSIPHIVKVLKEVLPEYKEL